MGGWERLKLSLCVWNFHVQGSTQSKILEFYNCEILDMRILLPCDNLSDIVASDSRALGYIYLIPLDTQWILVQLDFTCTGDRIVVIGDYSNDCPGFLTQEEVEELKTKECNLRKWQVTKTSTFLQSSCLQFKNKDMLSFSLSTNSGREVEWEVWQVLSEVSARMARISDQSSRLLCVLNINLGAIWNCISCICTILSVTHNKNSGFIRTALHDSPPSTTTEIAWPSLQV